MMIYDDCDRMNITKKRFAKMTVQKVVNSTSKLRPTTTLIIIAVITIFVLMFHEYTVYSDVTSNRSSDNSVSKYIPHLEIHKQVVDQYYEQRQYWKTSNLGTILFKNIDSRLFLHPNRENKTFVVLIWKYYEWLKERHIHNYNARPSSQLLNSCSVKNCIFIANDSAFEMADAVVIQMLRGVIPEVTNRPQNQRWVLLSDESANHTFTLAKKENRPSLSKLANVFNWTMTYRSDSDIPVPYGRTIPLSEAKIVDTTVALSALEQLVPYWDKKQFAVPIAILATNCIRPRMRFFQALKQYVSVDMYGGCSLRNKHSCPGHIRADCPAMALYPFYLVYENSKCRQYLTEKAFYHGYSKGAIPIILGPPKSDCEKLLPPNSYLHMEDFGTPKELARKIRRILRSKEKYEELLFYHKWRMHFDVVNEHGYFGSKSVHYCRVCEALNYNDGEVSIYDKNSLALFLDANLTCT